MATAVQRIKQYIDLKGIRVSTFEKSVGLSNGSIGSQLEGDKTIRLDRLEKILSVYTDLNPLWVLTGRGQMLLEDNEVLNEPGVEYTQQSIESEVSQLRATNKALTDSLQHLNEYVSELKLQVKELKAAARNPLGVKKASS